MKFAMSFFSVLALIITGIIFFQYHAYSSDLETGNGDFLYSQEIEIFYRENSLDIRQHFKNLPDQKVKIKWPENAINLSCFMETEKSCDRLSDEASYFAKGEIKSQSVSYIIPIEGGLKDKMLIQNVLATLLNGEATYSIVHISTDSKIAGQWITGLPLIGQQQLALVNYTMFSGNGTIRDIYWQSANLKVQEQSPILSIYAPGAIAKDFLKSLENLQFLNDQHIAIIQEKNPMKEHDDRLLFLPTLTAQAVEQEVVLSQIKSQYKFDNSPEWLPEVVASYLVKDTIGSEKTKEIVATLKEYMTTDQEAAWQEAMNKLGEEPITPASMDDLLTAVLGAKTSYFKLNTEQKNGTYPLFFEDDRDIYVNDALKKDVQFIHYEGQSLYTADTLLPYLGYSATEGENGYYVKSENRSFRFPKEPGFYVFNQRRYSTISEPIIKIAGHYYVEEAWLQRLFLVELQKNDGRIQVITQGQE
ncbi:MULTISPECIES: RNA polymerase II [Lysinibacillus]|uniref:RNA polymerase II n=1 Tax=Lysinibacillus pakistanensis TaxID=759811 RepID=A0AAX3X0P7_9BACI|nr:MULTISPECIES: RNA polymerase II [Lysinibacillus]MDM5232104.1 RNA polymerase II [Lysinibacillus pakistanensis]WHY47628.1 RNA polymerase II [Lysinibacillus pakistanensis]WHY52638.1 RNA polymerase II [Lysinibacillus pakistanensis]